MVEKKILAKKNVASPKGQNGPSDPGVKVDAGEEHHLKQAAASLNEPDASTAQGST